MDLQASFVAECGIASAWPASSSLNSLVKQVECDLTFPPPPTFSPSSFLSRPLLLALVWFWLQGPVRRLQEDLRKATQQCHSMEEQHTEMATRLERMTAAFKAERERRKEAEEKLYVSVLEEEEEKDNGEEEGRGEEVVVTRITLSLSLTHTHSHTHTLSHTLSHVLFVVQMLISLLRAMNVVIPNIVDAEVTGESVVRWFTFDTSPKHSDRLLVCVCVCGFRRV